MPHILYRILRGLAKVSLVSFYSELHVIGEENVPEKGPIVVVSTHHNMIVDPAVLASMFPHQRPLHYWAKDSLFQNPVGKYILEATGNIPVNRRSKDNAVLFKGTFKALSSGEVVALFPEGTSYTECRIMQIKDGAAWAALESMKFARDNNKPVPIIIVAGLVYTNKSKYRSNVVLEFGEPITLDQFEEEFLSTREGAQRSAAKKLTKLMEDRLFAQTVNAPDWEKLFLARTARDILFPNPRSLRPEHYVGVSQTLIDLFSTAALGSDYVALKQALLSYDSLLQSSRFTNADLAFLPLSSDLDPLKDIPTPTRLMTLSLLIRDTLILAIRFPFFLLPALIHVPIYLVGRFGGKLATDEEETQAQNKMVLGLLLSAIVNGSLFAILWTFFRRTAIGAIVAALTIWATFVYHRKMIDENYDHAKRLIAGWRVLVGVWIPSRFDISRESLAQYTTPYFPPISPYLGKQAFAPPPGGSEMPNSTETKPPSEPTKTRRTRPRGPPSRHLVRHVLRARAKAAHALSSFFLQLERSNDHVRASEHLAKAYGGMLDSDLIGATGVSETMPNGLLPPRLPKGWRSGSEVVRFLRSRGASLKVLKERSEDDWVLGSSDAETSRDSEGQSPPRSP